MQANNILSSEVEIDWNEITNKIENFYKTWTVVSQDLKEFEISDDKIQQFSQNLDNLAIAIQSKNKNDTLKYSIELYKFLPEYLKQVTNNDNNALVLDTKYKLLLCYQLVDLEKWDELEKRIK